MQTLDIVVIVCWLALTVGVGLWASRKSSTTDDYFVTDRSLPWWVIGTSMVATTFAADTPLAVSGYVAAAGISDNWKWWWTGVGAVVSVFLFAKLWRRAEVVTDAELAELRYGGTASKVLRGVKAIWFGVFLNVLIISWVMRAMQKIAAVVLDLPPDATLLGLPSWITITGALFVMAVAYTTTSGMWGVVMTDLPQFALAMFGSVTLAVFAWWNVGGISGMKAGFLEHGFDWNRTVALLPLDDPDPAGSTAKVVVLISVMWWAARNVDGGGYLAQRLFAAKDERHAQWGYLWFTIANLCIRPWPWIIVGLAGMALIGPLEDPELYYPMMMVRLLPAGLFGLMIASFLAAFMSTIDTQLHWGSSLLINDLYRRFIAPNQSDAHHLLVSRVAVVLLALLGALASFVVADIRFAWELAISITAGLGSVFVARWYWWRTSAYSEFAAMAVAAAGSAFFALVRPHHPDAVTAESAVQVWSWLEAIPSGWLRFPFDATAIVAVSIPIWVAVTFLTPPPSAHTLNTFYDRVYPGGPGWAAVAGNREDFKDHGPNRYTLASIVFGQACVFGWLLAMGGLFTGQWAWAVGAGAVAVVGTIGLVWAMFKESAFLSAVSGGAPPTQ